MLIVSAEPGSLKLPSQAAISVLSLGELRAGVVRAATQRVRAGREARLAAVRLAFRALPVDEEVAFRFGNLLALVRSRGRSEKASDLLIIATAAATDRVLYTLDRRQASLATTAGVGAEQP